MSTLFVAARTVHYASALLLFGELVFVIAVARPAWRGASAGDGDTIYRRLLVVARWSVIASMASGLAWLAAQAAVMSGVQIEQAMNRETLGLVLGNTVFGHVWALRFGLAIALVAVLLALRRSAGDPRRSRLAIGAAAVIAAAYLGSLAWAGHAVAGTEPDDLDRIIADVAHLLAAGAWLGALPALVHLLDEPYALDAVAQATRRYSNLAMASVCVLVLSGLTNAWYQVGDVPALIGTEYGRLVLAKLGLFATMLGLAVANRGVLTPRLAGGDRRALRSLRRNAVLEFVAGIGVVIIVGVLGLTVPAAHQSPVWPFDYTLSSQPLEQSAWMQMAVTAAGIVACISAAVTVTGLFARPPQLRFAALAGIVIPAGIFAWLLAVPAFPTTYAVSPVHYTADAIASGAALYASHCIACHGRDGSGDGTTVALRVKPPSLPELVPSRREGDLFWRIAHGVPKTPMPGFASQLNDTEIWNLIQFLDAQAEARNAIAMTDRVKPLRPVFAPDFTFEIIGRPQESLQQQRGNRVTLLVFYTLPQSLPRLQELAKKQRAIVAGGARAIAVPISASSSAGDAGIATHGESIFAIASRSVADAYAMFTRQADGSNTSADTHVEFLVDRHGYLRVRWIGVPDAATDRTTATLAQIKLLVDEPPRTPVQWGHRH